MLPRDPMLLVSVINMKLRDEYEDLDALCEDLELEREELEEKLKAAGFVYDGQHRAFR